MASTFFLVLSIVFILTEYIYCFPFQSCPFNTKECKCTKGDDQDPLKFNTVMCESTTGLPQFSAPPTSGRYKVTNFLVDSPLSYQLPANYFQSFSYIQYL